MIVHSSWLGELVVSGVVESVVEDRFSARWGVNVLGRDRIQLLQGQYKTVDFLLDKQKSIP